MKHFQSKNIIKIKKKTVRILKNSDLKDKLLDFSLKKTKFHNFSFLIDFGWFEVEKFLFYFESYKKATYCCQSTGL